MAEELKACPFCNEPGEEREEQGWYACSNKDCPCWHLQAELSDWNTRAQLPSQGGEAVAWMHSRSGAVATAATKSAMEDGSIPSGYDVPLYTHPVDQVAELVELLRDARTSVVGSSSTSAWFGDLLARIDASLAKL